MRFFYLTAGQSLLGFPSCRDFFGLRLFCIALCLELTTGTAFAQTNVTRVFPAHGTVLELQPTDQTIVIRHDAITGYMGAMTMPFKARNAADLSGLAAGDEITFKLEVNDTESHVENIVKTG